MLLVKKFDIHIDTFENKINTIPSKPKEVVIDPLWIKYINCIALERPDEKDTSKRDTVQMLERSPCWSYYTTSTTKDLILRDIIAKCKTISDKNNNTLKGPVYVLLGRNKDDVEVNAWTYLPSIDKNGNIVSSLQDFYSFHNWIRKLLFTNTYTVDHWLCNNDCNIDLTYNKDDIFAKYIPPTTYCGCISKSKCNYYYIPKDVSISPRKISDVSSYSVYRLTPELFKAFDITLEAPTQIEMDHFNNGWSMYEGCDNRLVSKNRLHSFEITPNGFGFYEAQQKRPFEDTCYPRPNQLDKENPPKTEKQKFKIIGELPRLINEDNEISISSIIYNPDTKRKELVKEWVIPTTNNAPHTLFLDDTGALKVIDSKGTIIDAKFSRPLPDSDI